MKTDNLPAGTKHDSDKPDLSLLPRVALELEAKAMQFGASKYGRYNYKAGFEYTRLLAAALRHINAFNDGEDNDPESGLTHLAHARCCLGMLLDCIELGTSKDNRYKRRRIIMINEETIMINEETIEKLNPCKKSLDKALKFYKGKSFTKHQFMGLKNIEHKDKVWVAFRLMPKENIRFAAADIAELVLHIYEDKYPGDSRPRKAIEEARKPELDPASLAAAADAASFGAHNAMNAMNAEDNAPRAHVAFTAYAAADAAAYTAIAANACSSAYAAADAASAASAAYAAANGDLVTYKQIRTIVLKYWK